MKQEIKKPKISFSSTSFYYDNFFPSSPQKASGFSRHVSSTVLTHSHSDNFSRLIAESMSCFFSFFSSLSLPPQLSHVFWKINGLSSGLYPMHIKWLFFNSCNEGAWMHLIFKLSKISWAVRAVWLSFWCCGEVGLVPPLPCRSVWTLAGRWWDGVAGSEMIKNNN